MFLGNLWSALCGGGGQLQGHKTSLDPLTKFLFSLQFFFFLLTTVTKKKPARKADGRTFEYKRSSSLGSCNRIGGAGGGDEARGCEGLNSDAGDSSTEDVESEFEKREDIQVLGPEISIHWSGRGPLPLWWVLSSTKYLSSHTPQRALWRFPCSFYEAFEAPSKHSSLSIWQTLLSNASKIYHITLPFFSS